jgi:hypothetical protein
VTRADGIRRPSCGRYRNSSASSLVKPSARQLARYGRRGRCAVAASRAPSSPRASGRVEPGTRARGVSDGSSVVFSAGTDHRADRSSPSSQVSESAVPSRRTRSPGRERLDSAPDQARPPPWGRPPDVQRPHRACAITARLPGAWSRALVSANGASWSANLPGVGPYAGLVSGRRDQSIDDRERSIPVARCDQAM